MNFYSIGLYVFVAPIRSIVFSMMNRLLTTSTRAARLSVVRAFSTSTFLPEAEVTERVLHVVKAFDKVDKAKLSPAAHFIKDLGLDSLDAVEVVMALEEEFVIEIPDDQAEKILTCADAIKLISQHPQAR